MASKKGQIYNDMLQSLLYAGVDDLQLISTSAVDYLKVHLVSVLHSGNFADLQAAMPNRARIQKILNDKLVLENDEKALLDL